MVTSSCSNHVFALQEARDYYPSSIAAHLVDIPGRDVLIFPVPISGSSWHSHGEWAIKKKER